jgi:hypothetical protein
VIESAVVIGGALSKESIVKTWKQEDVRGEIAFVIAVEPMIAIIQSESCEKFSIPVEENRSSQSEKVIQIEVPEESFLCSSGSTGEVQEGQL